MHHLKKGRYCGSHVYLHFLNDFTFDQKKKIRETSQICIKICCAPFVLKTLILSFNLKHEPVPEILIFRLFVLNEVNVADTILAVHHCA